jgi:hypothetical protein
MLMRDALEVILRYFVAIACGWLAQHGLKDFDSGDNVQAVTTIMTCVVIAGGLIWRALYKSTVNYVIERLKARHKVKLIAAANEVKAEAPPATSPAAAPAVAPSDPMVPLREAR